MNSSCIKWLFFFVAITSQCFADERPNVLFCMADDWGWPHAGVYGDEVVKTPSFDRIAKEGVLFEHAFVSSPSCTPCRNSILTGQQFYRLGQGANLHGVLNVKHPNFMFRFRDAGYEIGHWRKALGKFDFRPGGYTEHPCGPTNTFKNFMRKRDKTKPFCFWFGTGDPHRAYKKGSGRKSGIPVDKIHVPDFLPDNEVVRSDVADYYFEVQRWDRDVGAAMRLLEEAGELDNTIVIMTGDHGFPFPRGKGNLYDWGTRVPLAIRWGDNIPANRSVTDFVSLTDIAPSLLEVAGLDIPEEMTGKSLVPILQSEKSGRIDKDRDYVVCGRERHVPAQKEPSLAGYPSRALRTDKWLLVTNLAPDRWPAGAPAGATHRNGSYADCDNGPTKAFIMEEKDSRFSQLCFAKRGEIELYDNERDPEHVNNLAEDPEHKEVIEKLRAQLLTYLQETEDPRFTDEPVKFDTYPHHKPQKKSSRKDLTGKKPSTKPAAGQWTDLLEDGLTAWQESKGWTTGNEVIVNPANEKELNVSKPGKNIAVVEKRSKAAYLVTKQSHGDIEAVIEFMVPKGSNSGIYFMGRYEIQVFDSFAKADVEHSDCGGIYQRWGKNKDNGQPPRVNASTAPGTWQKFEVVFRAPRFGENGSKTANAKFIKVVHNGQLIHENAEVTGPTRAAMKGSLPEETMGPIRIQGDHGPVAYRTFKIKHVQLD